MCVCVVCVVCQAGQGAVEKVPSREETKEEPVLNWVFERELRS